MEPWGTPAFTGNQLEFEPLITTLFPSHRDNFQIFKFPEMSDCFSLWIKPLCQTLSNVLLISQKTTRTSFVILISWLTAESPFVNPDWQVVRISYPIDDCEYVYIHNAPLNYEKFQRIGILSGMFLLFVILLTSLSLFAR